MVIDKAKSDERGKAMGAFNATYSIGINFLAFPLGLIARDFGYEVMYLITGCLVFLGFLLFHSCLVGRCIHHAPSGNLSPPLRCLS